jgi:hypothetical protein
MPSAGRIAHRPKFDADEIAVAANAFSASAISISLSPCQKVAGIEKGDSGVKRGADGSVAFGPV